MDRYAWMYGNGCQSTAHFNWYERMKYFDRLLTEASLTPAEFQQLARLTLEDQQRARAFGLTAENVESVLQARSQLLRQVYPALHAFCQTQLGSEPQDTIWHFWLPLAVWLAEQRRTQRSPFIFGILGGQGTGKTTLGNVLTLMLKTLGYQTLSLSLDDLYKTHHDRQQLYQNDPRLIWRGPPGTHEVDLGLAVLDQLRQPSGQAIAIPRFDKSLHNGSGDRIAPELVSNIDIVLFEGWFVGARPIDPMRFETAPAPIVTAGDRTFARDMNTNLHTYLPLWERLDRLMVLYPVDYRYSKQWRRQAEQTMRAEGKPGMSDAAIEAFVEYFWKALHPELFIQPLVTQPNGADLVVEIAANHRVGAVYRAVNERSPR